MKEFFNYNKTTESTTWTLKHPDGRVATFKVVKNGNVIVTNGSTFGSTVEKAREIWESCIGRGFVISNKCINHDMEEFHKECRNRENKITRYALEA